MLQGLLLSDPDDRQRILWESVQNSGRRFDHCSDSERLIQNSDGIKGIGDGLGVNLVQGDSDDQRDIRRDAHAP